MPSGPLRSPSEAARLLEYNRAVFDRFVRRLSRLPWRVVSRRREIGHQTLFATLVHILNVHEVWIGYILQGRNSDAELERLFRDPTRRPQDWSGFQKYRRRVRDLTDAYLARLTARELSKPVRVFWMPGKYVASDGLLQTTFEQAHHLGEVIGSLWQGDIEPPEMTWIRVGESLLTVRTKR